MNGVPLWELPASPATFTPGHGDEITFQLMLGSAPISCQINGDFHGSLLIAPYRLVTDDHGGVRFSDGETTQPQLVRFNDHGMNLPALWDQHGAEGFPRFIMNTIKEIATTHGRPPTITGPWETLRRTLRDIVGVTFTLKSATPFAPAELTGWHRHAPARIEEHQALIAQVLAAYDPQGWESRITDDCLEISRYSFEIHRNHTDQSSHEVVEIFEAALAACRRGHKAPHYITHGRTAIPRVRR